MKSSATLPDYVAANLRLLSIGLNPSPISVQSGFYYANPRNRFWRAFADSGLAPLPCVPSAAYHRRLLTEARIGFTDVVKRHSRQGHELRVADFRRDAPKLWRLLEQWPPEWAWFQGKMTYRYFLRYGLGEPADTIAWGVQRRRLAGARVLVTPNPSPANAAFSLQDLCRRYRRLAKQVDG